MTITSFRRVAVAMLFAAGAAAAHGVWFGGATATIAGPDEARIRVMQWDEFQRIWVGSYIARPVDHNGALDTIRSAEGTIVELRPAVSAQAIDANTIPAFLEVLTAQQLADLNIPQPADTPLDNNQNPLVNLRAEGIPTFARLRVSRPATISTPRPAELGPDEVWAGPLDGTQQDIEALDVDGSVGVHTVVVATAGTTDNVQFLWDIGRWAKGDILLGVNNAYYKVLDKNGEFKRFIGSQDWGTVVNEGTYYEENPNEFTTGCAANWRTSEFYATNFAYEVPAINIFSRHPGVNAGETGSGAGWLRPYVNSNRRISTAAYRQDALDNTDPRSPIDKNPESVVFDAALNMYVGHSFPYFGEGPAAWDGITPAGWWGSWHWETGWPAYEWGINGKPIAFNEGGYPWLTDETGNLLQMRRQDTPGAPLQAYPYGFTSVRLDHTADRTALAPFITLDPVDFPELAGPVDVPQAFFADPRDGMWLVDGSGNRVPVIWPLGKRLHRYTNLTPGPGQTPTFATANRDLYWTFTSQQGTDAIDITNDGVVYYTSEDSYVHRYDPNFVGAGGRLGRQLPDVGGFKLGVDLGNGVEYIGRRYSGLRLLPPGDGTGGFLVAGGDGVFRYDQDGNHIQSYQILNDPDAGGLLQWLYALDIDPGGRTFWAFANLDSGWIYQFDIASGRELKRLKAVTYVPPYDDRDPENIVGQPDLPTGRRIEGVCVMWEYTAAQEACDNGIDDDGDGLIDESCAPIESCGNAVDEDGDGRSDNNDPDCGAELPPVAGDDFYTTREDRSLTIDLTHASKVMINDFDPDNDPTAQGYDPRRVDTLVVSSVGPSGTPAVAPGTSFQTANGGTVTLQDTGHLTYVPAADFHGVDTFVYRVNDGVNDSNIATVTITVVPEVADDSYTMVERTVLSVPGAGGIFVNDSNAPMTVIGAGAVSGTIASLGATGHTFTTARGGTVTITADGSFTYDPNGWVGVDTFVYRAHDGISTALQVTDVVAPIDTWATVTITVLDVNEVIAVNDGIFETGVGVAKAITVVANDRDPESHPFSVTHINGTPVTLGGSAVAVANGTAALTAAGVITFTPAPAFWGTTTFEYTITDVPGPGVDVATDTAVVTVRVLPSDLKLVDDYYQTRLNQTLTIGGPGILVNDTNRGEPVEFVNDRYGVVTPLVAGTVSNVETSFGGRVTVNADGSLSYTPALNFQGLDSFRYGLYDGYNKSYVATVFIRVLGEATVIAGGGTKVYGTPDPALSAITTEDFLAADLPGILLTQARDAGEIVGSYPVNATATAIAADGTPLNHYIVTYVPGVFTITKAPSTTTVTGGTYVYNGSPTPAQTCAVSGVNELGVMGPLPGGTVTYFTAEGQALAGPPTAVGTYTVRCVYDGDHNHFGSEGDNTITITPLEAVVIAGDGTKVYGTPDPALTAVTTTGFVNGDEATLTLDQSRDAGENVGSYVTTATADGAVLSNYTVEYRTGLFTITPAPSKTTVTGGTYVFDGEPKPQTCSVTGVNAEGVDGPLEGGTITYYDADGNQLPGAPSAVGVYTVRCEFDGDENHTGSFGTNTITITERTLTVTAVPVCIADTPYVTLTVSANYTPAAGTDITVNWVDSTNTSVSTQVLDWTNTAEPYTTQLLWPGAVLNEFGQIVDWPGWLLVDGVWVVGDDGFFNTRPSVSLQVSVNPTATVVVSYPPPTANCVAAPNNPPVAVDDYRETVGTTPVFIEVLENDSDPDGGQAINVVPTTYTQPANGTVTLSGNVFRFVADVGFTGLTTFTYTIVDTRGGTAWATVTILVTLPTEPCDASGYTTYSQGGWGSKPSGGNPGALLAQHFEDVYPDGLTLGGTHTITFTSASAIEKYLPAGGSARVLTSSDTNPTRSKGVLSAQLLAVQLAADFSAAGIFKRGMGDLVFTSGPMAGQTLNQLLTMANDVFGGDTSALPSGMTLSGLTSVLESVVNNYHEGTVNEGLLGCGDVTPPPPPPNPCVANPVVAVDDAGMTEAGTPVALQVLANDSGSALVIDSFTQPTGGLVTVSGGVLTFIPEAGFSGTATFTYTVKNADGCSDSATVSVAVASEPPPPPPPAGSGVCSGGVNKLVLKYIGAGTPADAVRGQRRAPGGGGPRPTLDAQVSGSAPVLYTFATTEMGGLFTSVSGGRLANEFSVFIGNTKIADVHTSCSVPIYPGMKVGTLFEIVEVWTVGGGRY